MEQVNQEGGAGKTKVFRQPGLGSSNFFMPLRYHGDGEVEQHGEIVAK